MSHLREVPEPGAVEPVVEMLRAVAALPYRERDILLRRYGPEALSVEDLAARFNVSPERIRQIELQSLVVLRDRLSGVLGHVELGRLCEREGWGP